MTHTLVPEELTDLGDTFRNELAASILVALAQANIPTDVQELLVYGNPMHDIPPGALSKACAVVWRAAIDNIPKLQPDAAETERLKAEVERLRAALQPSKSPFPAPFSVCYRGDWTEEAYDEAIESLEAAKQQLLSEACGEYQPGCAVCSDSGHTASSCHHNPLILARRWATATHVHTCYHCGFIATTEEEAQQHFGKSEDEVAACLVKKTDDAAKALVEAAKVTPHHDECDLFVLGTACSCYKQNLDAALRPFLKEGE